RGGVRPGLRWKDVARRAPASRQRAADRGGANGSRRERLASSRVAMRGGRRARRPAVKTLVLHGFAGSPGAFARVFPDGGAPSLPGHGSAPDATSWEDALARLEPDEPVAVFGYSMGARLALALALHRPEAVRELILESGTAGIEDPVPRARRKA